VALDGPDGEAAVGGAVDWAEGIGEGVLVVSAAAL
jgi:hypothetical protein